MPRPDAAALLLGLACGFAVPHAAWSWPSYAGALLLAGLVCGLVRPTAPGSAATGLFVGQVLGDPAALTALVAFLTLGIPLAGLGLGAAARRPRP